jgi:acetylornithine deacetylase/succinyl-diaminopimelate desuccinylase family protein
MSNVALRSLLADLIRIDSVNAFYTQGPGEAELSRYIEKFFRQAGLAVERQTVIPATDRIESRDNIVVRLPGSDRTRRLVLEAHMDTVSALGMSIDPFDPHVENGYIFGRGSVDTKAGLAAMMAAIVDLKQRKVTPRCDLIFAAVVDEEYSFRGVTKLAEDLQADGAIVAEPTELKIVVASKGVLRWQIKAHGKSAHSSKSHLGINAIVHMADLIQAIEVHHRRLAEQSHPLLGSPTANVGLIQGGQQVNFVPSECVIEIDRRMLPDESPDRLLDEYQSMIADLQSRNPSARFELVPPYLVDPAMQTSSDAPIVVAAQRAADALGLDSQTHGVPFGSDASKLARKGIPTIIFGPGSIDQAHTDREYVELSQVDQAFEFYRSTIGYF